MVQNPHHRPLALARPALLALAVATVLAAGTTLIAAHPLSAQRQLPPGGRGIPSEILRRYGTRHIVPMVDAAGNGHASATLRVANNSYKSTQIVVVELGSASALSANANCPAGLNANRIVNVDCPALLPPFGAAELQLAADRTVSVLVYSLNPVSVTNACAALQALRDGTKPLETWEQDTWQRGAGEPIAVTVESSTSSAVTGITGRPLLDVPVPQRADGQGGQAARNAQVNQGLPLVWTGSQNARVRVFNPTAQCQTIRTRLVSTPPVAKDCTQDQVRTLQLPAYGAADIDVPGGGLPASMGIQSTAQLLAMGDNSDTSGWMSYMGSTSGGPNVANDLAFPIAVSPFPNTTSELWVANEHVTATATIDILMWDGNGKLIKAYTDPSPLCSGATRHYDVKQLAGEVETTRTGGRTGVPGFILPPMVSMRVQSTNRDLPDAPPIAGVMVLKNDLGVTAFSGMPANYEANALQAGLRASSGQLTTVVPNFKINYGSPPESTFLAAQILSQPTPNFMIISLYDAAGNLVVDDLQVGLGQGLVGSSFLDMAMLGGRRLGPADTGVTVPQSFVGTAVIRGQNGLGQIGVLAVNHPLQLAQRQPRQPLALSPELQSNALSPGQHLLGALSPGQLLQGASSDRLAMFSGVILPRWADPNAPTPTARPTPNGTPSATPAGPRPTRGPTMEPTREPTTVPTVEPTPTMAQPVRHWLWLPLLNDGLIGE